MISTSFRQALRQPEPEFSKTRTLRWNVHEPLFALDDGSLASRSFRGIELPWPADLKKTISCELARLSSPFIFHTMIR